MKDITIEQAANNLEQLINATPLKKAEYDVLYASLSKLFATAQGVQKETGDEKSA